MRNRSRTHTPVNLGNQTCIGELVEIRGMVDWCTRIPLSTPLARLVTPDLAVGMIERDHSAGRERARDPIEGWSAAACEAGVPGFNVRSMQTAYTH